VDSTLGGSRLGELAGRNVLGIIRDEATLLAVKAEQTIRQGDRLLMAADPGQADALADLGGVEIATTSTTNSLESGNPGMSEAAIAPRSGAEGRSLRELGFRDRYSPLLALALMCSLRTRVGLG
jgi:hypothetical protein